MKTTKLMLVLGLALIFASGFGNMIGPKIQTNKITVENKANVVTYVVRIENASYLNAGAQYLVMMTDGAGHPVAPAKYYRPGTSDYTFTEGGTVRGTRAARMVKLPAKSNSFGIPPTVKHGIFYGGTTHLFIIRPTNAEIDNGDIRE